MTTNDRNLGRNQLVSLLNNPKQFAFRFNNFSFLILSVKFSTSDAPREFTVLQHFFNNPHTQPSRPTFYTWPVRMHIYGFVPFVVDGLDAGHMIQTCCWSRLVPSGICVRATNTCHLLPYLICSIDPQAQQQQQLHFSSHFSSPPSLGRPSVCLSILSQYWRRIWRFLNILR